MSYRRLSKFSVKCSDFWACLATRLLSAYVLFCSRYHWLTAKMHSSSVNIHPGFTTILPSIYLAIIILLIFGNLIDKSSKVFTIWLKMESSAFSRSSSCLLFPETWFNVDPTPATLAQHWNNIGSMSRVCSSRSVNIALMSWLDLWPNKHNTLN